MEIGWWIWNKGSSVKGTVNDQGWARSHFSFMLPLGGGLQYRYKRLIVEAKASYAWLFDYELINSEDATRNYDRFRIATDKTVEFWKVGGSVGYRLIKLPRYAFTPKVSVGWFGTDIIHPEKDRFQNMIWWSVGLEQEVLLGNWAIGMAPQYTQMHVGMRDKEYYNEQQTVYVLGFELSLTYWFGL